MTWLHGIYHKEWKLCMVNVMKHAVSWGEVNTFPMAAFNGTLVH